MAKETARLEVIEDVALHIRFDASLVTEEFLAERLLQLKVSKTSTYGCSSRVRALTLSDLRPLVGQRASRLAHRRQADGRPRPDSPRRL